MAYQKQKIDGVRLALIGGGLCVALYVLRPLLGVAQAGISELSEAAQTPAMVKRTGANVELVKVLSEVANTIYKAFRASWQENEDLAIDSINRCKTAFQLESLATIYQMKYGLDLRADFDSYTSSYNYYTRPLSSVVAKYLGV